MKKLTNILLSLILIQLLISCGHDESDILEHTQRVTTQSTENLNHYLKSVKKVIVEVKYEPGAEPYTDKNFRNRHYWTFLESNLKGIYDAREMEVELVVPKELDDMEMLQLQEKESWTADEILELANKASFTQRDATTGVFKVLFLKGHYKSEGTVKESVIGLNITGTEIIAIFKDVVEDMGRKRDDNIAKFSEQSTLVHEIGHAIGLVNNGVTQVEPHHDSEHGAHCSNEDCVMYWKNEGAASMVDFIQKYFSSGSELMFGEKCMNDLKNYQ
ncbi:lipoprotein [Bacteriovorax sp. DB6_IX]|uniref:lipoprotein n=1 Tax=Bacteriovorax sp. DB6_IX TaxID=1353530 RepID=UPI000389E33D|nr:lipoprotein [Bacteriovorax sp. DB6_IX]EQC49656.1 putative lipoprotein [Bacteriovorax sp. DB6_IX]